MISVLNVWQLIYSLCLHNIVTMGYVSVFAFLWQLLSMNIWLYIACLCID